MQYKVSRIIALLLLGLSSFGLAMEQEFPGTTKRKTEEELPVETKKPRSGEKAETNVQLPVLIKIICNDEITFIVPEPVLNQSEVLKTSLAFQRKQTDDLTKHNILTVSTDGKTLYLLIQLLTAQHINADLNAAIDQIQNQTNIQINDCNISGIKLLQEHLLEAFIQAHAYQLPSIAQTLASLLVTPENIETLKTALKPDLQLELLTMADVNKENFIPLLPLLSLQIDEFLKKAAAIEKQAKNQEMPQEQLDIIKQNLRKPYTDLIKKFSDCMISSYHTLAEKKNEILANLSNHARLLLKRHFQELANNQIVNTKIEKTKNLKALLVFDNFLLLQEKTDVTLIQMPSGKILKKIAFQELLLKYVLETASISPDGKYLVAIARGRVFIYDLEQEKFLEVIDTREDWKHIAWISNDEFISAVAQRCEIIRYSIPHLSATRSILSVDSFTLHPNKKIVAINSARQSSGDVSLYDLEKKKYITGTLNSIDKGTFIAITNPVTMAFSHNGQDLIFSQNSVVIIPYISSTFYIDSLILYNLETSKKNKLKLNLKGTALLGTDSSDQFILISGIDGTIYSINKSNYSMDILTTASHVVVGPWQINLTGDGKYLVYNFYGTGAPITIIGVESLIRNYFAKQLATFFN